MFTLEEVNWDDDLLELSSTLFSKHILQTIYISISPTSQQLLDLKKTHALGHNPVIHLSPNGRGVMDWANSIINKQ